MKTVRYVPIHWEDWRVIGRHPAPIPASVWDRHQGHTAYLEIRRRDAEIMALHCVLCSEVWRIL